MRLVSHCGHYVHYVGQVYDKKTKNKLLSRRIPSRTREILVPKATVKYSYKRKLGAEIKQRILRFRSEGEICSVGHTVFSLDKRLKIISIRREDLSPSAAIYEENNA